MKKLLFAIIGLIGLTSAMPKSAQSEVAFSIFISNAPPPPRVAFVHQPRFVLVPEEDVYYCGDEYSDYDMFQYGSYYYMYDDGYWYRAPSYSGPFVAIRIEYVPRQIFYVSDYGYQWRQTPRWGSRSYASWNEGDRRFRDWRVSDRSWSGTRYRNSTRDYVGSIERRDDGRRYASRDYAGSRMSEPWRSRAEVRSGVREGRYEAPSSRLSEPWRNRSEVRSGVRSDRGGEVRTRDDGANDREWRGNRSDGNDDEDRGRGHGKGKGNGKGHGRGHNKD